MQEFTQWYSTTIYEMPRGDSTLLHSSSNYYISSAARTHVLGFLSFKHRHLANYEHHKKVQSWQLVYINNQNLTENLPKFCDSSPMMSLILFLIWRLSSKAITQSAFCTYVSEIYFYTFLRGSYLCETKAWGIKFLYLIWKQEHLRTIPVWVSIIMRKQLLLLTLFDIWWWWWWWWWW